MSQSLHRKKPRGGQKNLMMRVFEYLESEEFERFNNAEDERKYDTEAIMRRRKYNRRASRYESNTEEMDY